MSKVDFCKAFGSSNFSQATALVTSGQWIHAAGYSQDFTTDKVNRIRFLRKYDLDGNLIWEKRGETGAFPVSSEGGIADTVPSLASEPSGSLYIAGRILVQKLLTDDFAVPSRNNLSSPDGYVTKIGSDGKILWSLLIEPINGGRYGGPLLI